MFGDLNPVKYGFNNRVKNVKSSMFGTLYETTMDAAITTKYGRGPEYRPSSFPTCPILHLLRFADGANKGYFANTMTTSGGYFTSVGTAAHENIQYYIGQTGKIWGDWKCKNPTCQRRHDAQDLFGEDGKCWRKGKLTRKNTVNNKCPTCEHPMEYVEKEIRYKGLKGHIDAIVKLDGGGWWVADYKTCTKNKIAKKGKDALPFKAHLKQIPSYCYVLEKKYGMKIKGFSLLYLSRDNPFHFFEYSEPWTERWRVKVKKVISDEKRKYRSGVQSFYERDVKHAIANKPCSCLAQYESEINFYEECPLLGICFKPNLDKKLRAMLKETPYTDAARDNIIARLPMEVQPNANPDKPVSSKKAKVRL
ncbi:PD-(D/E)XK nuclease superfamily protein [compost metagenome]